MNVEFGMANQYSRDLSTNVKRGIRTKLEKGIWYNKAPLGYINNQLTKEVEIDIKSAHYIKRIFELYSTAMYSYKQLADVLYNEGFRSKAGQKVHKARMCDIIHNPFYYGYMSYEGKLYEGKHKAIISKEEFIKAQEVNTHKITPRKKRIDFVLRGLLRCSSCGCMYTASKKKGHDYYYCTNGKNICDSHKTYTREKVLYEKVNEILQSVVFKPELVEIMYKAAKESLSKFEEYNENTLKTYQEQLKTAQDRQSNLLDTYLDKTIPKDVYGAKYKQISQEIQNIENSIFIYESKKNKLESTLEPTKKFFLDCKIKADSFSTIKDESKKEIAHELLWNLNMKGSEVLNYKLKSPYEILAKVPNNATFEELLAD